MNLLAKTNRFQPTRRAFVLAASIFLLPLKAEAAPSERPRPDWILPENIEAIIAEEGIWESEQFEPIFLTILGDTSYRGRAIPLTRQIEFSPSMPEFEEANRRIAEDTGSMPDAFAWANLIVNEARRRTPGLAADIHSEDTETSTCVLWTETEPACRLLVDIVWDYLAR